MDNTDIQKQLQFRRLMSQIHGFVKLNFASSLKKRIFATSFNRKERPRESAFSLFRRRELGHFTKVQSRNEVMVSPLDCIRFATTYTKWSFIKRPHLLCTNKRESKPYV